MKHKKMLCTLLAALCLTVPLYGCSQNSSLQPIFPILGSSNAPESAPTSEPSPSTSDPTPSTSPSTSDPTPSTSTSTSDPTPSTSPSTSDQTPSTSPSSSPTGETITPAAWKVEDRNGHIIYMMGSIHMGDEAVNYMPDYVEQAYQSCDSIAVEADISGVMEDPSLAQQYAPLFLYTDGTTIEDHLSPETYQGAVNKLTAAGLYNAAYNRFRPFIWTSLLSTTITNTIDLDAANGVDLKFITRAKADNKPVREIESLTFQFEMFNSFSDELSDLMVAEYLQPNFDTYTNESTLDLYEQWKAGTVSEDLVLSGTFTDVDSSENAALYQEYIDKLILTRNRSMTNVAEQYLQNGDKVFFLVGVLHYYGEGGILDLLQKDGYTVTRLHP